jgi:hypothetical protein
MQNIKYKINAKCNRKLYHTITQNPYNNNLFFLSIIRRPIVSITKTNIIQPIRLHMHHIKEKVCKI